MNLNLDTVEAFFDPRGAQEAFSIGAVSRRIFKDRATRADLFSAPHGAASTGVYFNRD